MDGSRFDTLVKALATTRLTRSHALRGLAASAAALAGVRLTAERGTAKKNNKQEIRICVCADANPSTCKTQKKEKAKAKKTLRRNPCAYRGRCLNGVSGCAGSLTGPQGPAGPPGPGAVLGVCPAPCPTCETCNPATGECAVDPGRNGQAGTGCAAPNVCCNGTCCVGVHQCNIAGTCATCAQVCDANCTLCVNLAQGGTRCAGGIGSPCAVPCTSPAECPSVQPTCVVSRTTWADNQTTFPCPTPPSGYLGWCTHVESCV